MYSLKFLHDFNEFIYFISYKAGNCEPQTLIHGKCIHCAYSKVLLLLRNKTQKDSKNIQNI